MKKLIAVAICSLPFALAPAAYAQTAGTANTNGAGNGTAVSSEAGHSVKDGIIGKTVYNENDDKIGNITDALVSSDGKITSLVVGAGGFLGMGEHNVAIPFDKITKNDDKLILAGYTKDQLKALPAYKSPKSDRPKGSRATRNPAATGAPGTPRAPGNGSMPGGTTAPGTPGAPAPR